MHILYPLSDTPDSTHQLISRARPELGVLDKGDIQNMQATGACRTYLKTTDVGCTWTTHTHTHTHTCTHTRVMVFILYKQYFSSTYTNLTPKPTPLQKTWCVLRFAKTSFCMIYRLVYSRGQKKCPHKDKDFDYCHLWPWATHTHTHARKRKRTCTRTHTHTQHTNLSVLNF